MSKKPAVVNLLYKGPKNEQKPAVVKSDILGSKK